MYPLSTTIHILTEQSTGTAPVPVGQDQQAGLGPLLLLLTIGFLVTVVVRRRPPVHSQTRHYTPGDSSGPGLPDHGLRRDEFRKAAGTVLVTGLVLVVVVRHFLFG